ncbi:MAG: D-alanyl-D-alanine carboxypeptidase [Clostridiales bacterium]|nr:D-alanyl-D-alanine carboxypeptidase [Clostridiales bacterium]
MKKYQRFLWYFCTLILAVRLTAVPVYAADAWPEAVEISAEGGILMEAGTGTVLYEKNIHNTYYPASITKILTALIVIENCDLDDTVVFSHDAVFNVEAGSSSAALDVGDELTVRECLYAMLLKSANEAANALAEHTAGSISAFADMMNEKAQSLGCVDSHFNNPSGLNDPAHYTSAYDMALIAQAAFQNETFTEIDSTLYHDLPATKRNPDGLRIYPGHRMLKKNSSLYYPGIVGGKTGYTSLAGNTLVTCAERDGMKLISVVLNGHQTHYTDTRTLLNFGFKNFKSVPVSDIDSTYASVENDMTIAGLPTTDLSVLSLEDDSAAILPVDADGSDVSSSITYELPAQTPETAVAQISYYYGDHAVGSSYLLLKESHAQTWVPEIADAALPLTDDTAASDDSDARSSRFHIVLPSIHIPTRVFEVIGILAALAAIIAAAVYLKYRTEKKEESERVSRHNRRMERLHDIGMSPSDFDLLMQEKRTTGTISNANRPAKKPKKHPSFLDHKSYKDL